MKTEKRKMARILRSAGQSIKTIAAELKVSPGSVSFWVKDIILTPEMLENLKMNNPIYNKALNGSKKFSAKKLEERKKHQEQGKQIAKKMQPLHIKGCMLYWAEGTKNQNACIFTNSDADMIKLFLKFIETYFATSKEKITIHLNCYVTTSMTIEKIEKYWLSILDLPKSCLRKHTIKNESSDLNNKIPNGVCTIRCGGVDVVQHIYGAINEYAGIQDYCLNGKYGAITEN